MPLVDGRNNAKGKSDRTSLVHRSSQVPFATCDHSVATSPAPVVIGIACGWALAVAGCWFVGSLVVFVDCTSTTCPGSILRISGGVKPHALNASMILSLVLS